MTTHKRTVGDTKFPLGARLKQVDTSGTVTDVDVTNLTVQFKMADSDGNTKIALTSSYTAKVDSSLGKVQYTFQTADVDTAGVFHAWFVLEDVSSLIGTFPNNGETFEIIIAPSIANS